MMFKMGMESMDWNLRSFLPPFLFELNKCMHRFEFHGSDLIWSVDMCHHVYTVLWYGMVCISRSMCILMDVMDTSESVVGVVCWNNW